MTNITMMKLCPLMSRGIHPADCYSHCMAYIPPTDHYFACTLELTIKNYSELCKSERYIEAPDTPQEMTCDGCEYYKKIQCTPIPARCKLMERKT